MDTLSITKSLMSKYKIKANKRYGQNFLIDDNILEKIVDASNIGNEDLVIEIGPGLGNLTEYILDKCKYAFLVEIDKNMMKALKYRFKGRDNFKLLNEDVLSVNIREVVESIEKEINFKFKNIRVVANLPYYITTPILFKLLERDNNITTITVMVQKEVADRMVASPKTKDYGILTVMVKYYSDASIVMEVPNTAFIPSPEVTSAVITLKKEKRYKVKNEELFFELVHKAFLNRRKKMVNSLYASSFNNMTKEEIEDVFKSLNIGLNTRAEELDIDKYVEIIEKIG